MMSKASSASHPRSVSKSANKFSKTKNIKMSLLSKKALMSVVSAVAAACMLEEAVAPVEGLELGGRRFRHGSSPMNWEAALIFAGCMVFFLLMVWGIHACCVDSGCIKACVDDEGRDSDEEFTTTTTVTAIVHESAPAMPRQHPGGNKYCHPGGPTMAGPGPAPMPQQAPGTVYGSVYGPHAAHGHMGSNSRIR